MPTFPSHPPAAMSMMFSFTFITNKFLFKVTHESKEKVVKWWWKKHKNIPRKCCFLLTSGSSTFLIEILLVSHRSQQAALTLCDVMRCVDYFHKFSLCALNIIRREWLRVLEKKKREKLLDENWVNVDQNKIHRVFLFLACPARVADLTGEDFF